MTYLVTRTIGIDAGHRIMTHGSKCRHLHGHRYTIEATCKARGDALQSNGEQTDMVIDFGFLKEEMERHIDAPCDHGFIAALGDVEVLAMFAPLDCDFEIWHQDIRAEIEKIGYCTTVDCRLQTKLYIVDFHPTAECLAKHWFMRLDEAVRARSGDAAVIDRVRVWETPNCWAEYGA
ncbi:6-carboxytetrahydropterin synthase [Varunaivibrio sulfuroxidans]|uniref:6-carboxy-5,6,7,8-tetrahydropterin synthase n=1 Tax=Varunaivibrio sulfuroxidans TaxID=1773489 RepID=A0A4R3JGM8_9PROT|nr:6-carboxytetrahydropterin synthase [Varunaivibrio sulfuroxidans]TCS65082.1 6-pyruvoyltetrahydropterin/6-carboxytetrahydropterin synthase [Varunaivibrio sulfuroxidans]WES29631.1 6-carboxytetrahydropterin synthase [Varunaivibrio sulfuroxidans]